MGSLCLPLNWLDEEFPLVLIPWAGLTGASVSSSRISSFSVLTAVALEDIEANRLAAVIGLLLVGTGSGQASLLVSVKRCVFIIEHVATQPIQNN